jgi:hypothetical protein
MVFFYGHHFSTGEKILSEWRKKWRNSILYGDNPLFVEKKYSLWRKNTLCGDKIFFM